MKKSSHAPRRKSSVLFMYELIIFNEPVKFVRKSHQTIHSRIGLIRLQLFLSQQITDSNDPFRASLQWTVFTNLTRTPSTRATDAVKTNLLMSNFRINYFN